MLLAYSHILAHTEVPRPVRCWPAKQSGRGVGARSWGAGRFLGVHGARRRAVGTRCAKSGVKVHGYETQALTRIMYSGLFGAVGHPELCHSSR